MNERQALIMDPKGVPVASLLLALALAGCSMTDSRVPSAKAEVAARDIYFPLRTIDPADDDFSDLQFLRGLIGTASIVMLGEPHHGAGTSVAARARLVKFLHGELGFDALVFEAPFFTCNYAWQEVRKGEGSLELLQEAVIPIWSRSEQGRPLFEEIFAQAHDPRPLVLYGMDPQFITSDWRGRPRQAFGGEFRALLEFKQCGSLWNKELLAALIDTTNLDEPPSAEQAAYRTALTSALEATAACSRASARSYPEAHEKVWDQVLWNLEQLASSRLGDHSDPMLPLIRERAMAANVDWIRRQQPGRRTIVWAANLHISKDLDSVMAQGLPANAGETPVGELLVEAYGREEIFSILTSSMEEQYRDGSIVRVEKTEIDPSIESQFLSEGRSAGILDLRAYGAKHSDGFVSTAFGLYERTARWNEVADALLYLPLMERGHFPKK
ncbi:MAG: erythromycin esterase family protein [Thermoanaerobaculia bacterium]